MDKYISHILVNIDAKSNELATDIPSHNRMISVSNGIRSCTKCQQTIHESHLLLADHQFWHEDCLRCVCCDVRLAEVDKIFYSKASMPLCRRDYLRYVHSFTHCDQLSYSWGAVIHCFANHQKHSNMIRY